MSDVLEVSLLHEYRLVDELDSLRILLINWRVSTATTSRVSILHTLPWATSSCALPSLTFWLLALARLVLFHVETLQSADLHIDLVLDGITLRGLSWHLRRWLIGRALMHHVKLCLLVAFIVHYYTTLSFTLFIHQSQRLLLCLVRSLHICGRT